MVCLRVNQGNRHRNRVPVALGVQDRHLWMAREEDRKGGSIGWSPGEDQMGVGIDWAVGQREKDAGPVAAPGEVGSLDSVGESLGPRTDY